MACSNCTVTIREELALVSEITGPVVDDLGNVCYKHTNGDGVVSDICTTASQMELNCDLGCATIVHSNGTVVTDQTFGATHNCVFYGRPTIGDAVNATTQPGPIPATTVCGTIDVGCCGGVIKIDGVHSATSFNNFNGGANLIHQVQLDGGPWGTFGAKIDQFVGDAGVFAIGEHLYPGNHSLVVGPGLHQVCFRVAYSPIPTLPTTTQGNLDLGEARYSLSTINLSCC